MDNKFLSRDNIFLNADKIYNEINKKYGIKINGLYLENIQKIMHDLWNKNKNKKLKPNQSPERFIRALNKKTYELILPQVINSIESGYLNYSNNVMFNDKEEYNNAQKGYEIPRPSNTNNNNINNNFEEMQRNRDTLLPKKENIDFSDNNVKSFDLNNTDDLFERIKNERGNSDINIYSSENYQNKSVNYDNSLPQQQNIMKPAERYINGQPLNNNNDETNNQSTKINEQFSNNNNIFNNNNSDFDKLIDERNMNFDRGEAETEENFDNFFRQNTNLKIENMNVDKKFEEEKNKYNQENFTQRDVKKSSNKVEDVLGTSVNNSNIFNEEYRENDRKELFKNNDNQNTNNVVQQNLAQQKYDLELSNDLSNNVNINYPLIPPVKRDYITRKYYLTIDSTNRDLYSYPNPNNFQVRFEQPDLSYEIPTRLDGNGVVIFNQYPVVYNNVGGRGAKLENIYENIVEIRCIESTIPFEGNYLDGYAPYCFENIYPFNQINKENYGIPIDALSEPFYFLVIDELDGPYDGTNKVSNKAIAKLNFDKYYGFNKKFVNLKTMANEGATYYPTALAKLSQMTLKLNTRFDNLINIGIDKVYIKRISQGDLIGESCPSSLSGKHYTNIEIVNKDGSYNTLDNEICSLGLSPGDRLLFHSILECASSSRIYTELNKNIILDFYNKQINNNIIMYYANLYMNYNNGDEIVKKNVDINRFLNTGDVLIVNKEYYFEIFNITNNGESMTLIPRYKPYTKCKNTDENIIEEAVDDVEEVLDNNFDINTEINNKGYIKIVKSGVNNDTPTSFLYKAGHIVGKNSCNPKSFQVYYPYEDLPYYLKEPFYKEKDAFFIQAGKQISYTFEVTCVQPNMEKLDSRII